MPSANSSETGTATGARYESSALEFMGLTDCRASYTVTELALCL
jgi:hypothetical protein